MKFMQIKPQKCRGAFKESMWTDPAWSAEDKFDGDRRIAQFMGTEVRFTGTRESVDGTGYVEKSENLPHLSDESPRSLEGTVLDGEIVAPWADALPGGSSKHVTAIMGSSPERAVALQRERGWLEYRVFDCLWANGKDVRLQPLSVRRSYAEAALQGWGNKYAKIVPWTALRDQKHNAWVKAREGLVFKHADHTYGNERLWVKLKKEATADVIVMGFTPGKGKYKGQVGSIIFGQLADKNPPHSKHRGDGACCVRILTRMGTVRGFTDALMCDMTDRPKKYMGRVFRIKHYGREPTGAFRHPQFDGWRDDKDPKDCVYDPEET